MTVDVRDELDKYHSAKRLYQDAVAAGLDEYSIGYYERLLADAAMDLHELGYDFGEG